MSPRSLSIRSSMSAGMPMPTGILRFFNFVYTPQTRIDCKPSSVLSCVKLRILRLREVFLHVFLTLPSQIATSVKPRMLEAAGFSPFWVYHTSHKHPLMRLQESGSLQHCKNVCSLKNYVKMVNLINAVDATEKPLYILGD